ncbi:MAG TPA: lipopolysaccharide heptosyltransferase II [Xanthobacteraceae bacterium]|nr:lipopolysaccharide heptosyltransferase II [Xanthobacteraceae bacterium]
MRKQSNTSRGASGLDAAPVLIVPYQWIGDFVRCHSVVKLLKSQDSERPIDVLASSNAAPLLDYMPGVRKGIVCDLPRRRLALRRQWALARRLRQESYGQVLVMPRTWKAALAPALAGIPHRTGFVGEWRFGLLNDLRFGERKLPRMIDQCSALALPPDAQLPSDWPLPELVVPSSELAAWRQRTAPHAVRTAAIAPGAVGPSKRWPATYYRELSAALARDGVEVWVVGGPGEKALAQEIAQGLAGVRDLTGHDLRNAILALAAADVAVSNDSGLLHVAAALGTPSIGIFGPTSPWHWAPLNPLAAIVQAEIELDCRPCHKPVCSLGHHLCMREITPQRVAQLARHALARAPEMSRI